MTVKEKFLGKPSGTLALVPNKYVHLDNSHFHGDGGSQDVLGYVNISYTLDNPDRPGRVRYRVVREAWKGQAADPTSYRDIALLVGFNDALDTIPWWESGEEGRPLHIELKIEKATGHVGTRYTKHRHIS